MSMPTKCRPNTRVQTDVVLNRLIVVLISYSINRQLSVRMFVCNQSENDKLLVVTLERILIVTRPEDKVGDERVADFFGFAF
jgi:hypothetical protein